MKIMQPSYPITVMPLSPVQVEARIDPDQIQAWGARLDNDKDKDKDILRFKRKVSVSE